MNYKFHIVTALVCLVSLSSVVATWDTDRVPSPWDGNPNTGPSGPGPSPPPPPPPSPDNFPTPTPSPYSAPVPEPAPGQPPASPAPAPTPKSAPSSPVAPIPSGTTPADQAAPTTPAGVILASVGAVPVSRLQLGDNKVVGGTLQGFLEYVDEKKGVAYRLCSASTFFNSFTASLACQQFGNAAGGLRVNPVPFIKNSPAQPKGSLPFFHCNNTATSLDQCTSGALIVDPACPEQDIIYIKCYGEGALRLVDGPSVEQGRLQILINGRWYNTCSDNIKGVTAQTACRLMGFTAANVSRINSSIYDPDNSRFSEPNAWFPYISCKGNEGNFKSCLHAQGAQPYGNIGASENCYPTGADAALVCGDPKVAAAARAKTGLNAAGRTAAVRWAVQLLAFALGAVLLV